MRNDKYITIQELAGILGISRIAVYKKVKQNKIKAVRIGRNYFIPRRYVASIIGHALSESAKRNIDKAIKKTVREYGEKLKLLGNT